MGNPSEGSSVEGTNLRMLFLKLKDFEAADVLIDFEPPATESRDTVYEVLLTNIDTERCSWC